MSETSLARSSAVMALGTVTSRLLGFVRAAVLSGTLGIGVAADTWQVANTLPTQFYLLLAGGVLNAVLVPQITKASAREDGGEVFVNRLLTVSFALIALATVVVTAAAPLLVRLFSQGWSPEALALATSFAAICLPQILFFGLYTLLGQVLNARGRFAAYMWAPALANLVAIAGLLLFRLLFPSEAPVSEWTPAMIGFLAGTATLGVAAQALVLVIPLRRSGFRYRPAWGIRGSGLGSASRVALWTFAGVAVAQAGFIVTSKVMTRAGDLIESRGEVGAGIFAYGLAFLLFMLPHSLVTVSLVTALFTRLSQAATRGDDAEVVADLGRGLRMPAVILVPVTFGVVLLGQQLVRVAFYDNSPEAVEAIAEVMVAMMVGIVPYGWLYLIQRVYYAYEDARTPFRLQLVVTAVATLVNLLAAVVDPLRTGVVVGIGQTVSNLAAALLGFWLLRRRFGRLGLSATVRVYARLVLATVLAGALTWLLLVGLDRLGVDGRTWTGALLELVVGGGVFAVAVLVLAHALRVEEVRQLLAPLLRRVSARRGGGGAGTT
ncbi:MAG TPA: murein biosynthesis integral membrane protein MurJ [Pedococcus sp.]